MSWKDNPKEILTMVQTMVLWIDNDYEDEGLKSRAKEINGLLERLEDLLQEDNTRTLLEQWRDYHWREHLHYKFNRDRVKLEAAHHVAASVYDDAAYLIRRPNKPPKNVSEEYKGYVYGEYPKEER